MAKSDAEKALIKIEKEAFRANTQRLIARFRGITLKVKSEVGRALARVGAVVSTEAKKVLAENKSVVTNRLRSSITFRVAADESYVEIGTNVVYGPYVEYGWKWFGFTSTRGRGKSDVPRGRARVGGGRMDTAFLRPAYFRKIDWARAEIARAVKGGAS